MQPINPRFRAAKESTVYEKNIHSVQTATHTEFIATQWSVWKLGRSRNNQVFVKRPGRPHKILWERIRTTPPTSINKPHALTFASNLVILNIVIIEFIGKFLDNLPT